MAAQEAQSAETADMRAVGRSAIFSRRRPRVMHAVQPGTNHTVCNLPVGVGSGLVRDGDYRDNTPCPRCWTPATPTK